MLRSLLNREMRNTNGAMNPCHRPSQNPTTELLSVGVPFRAFGPGAQAARTTRKRRARMNAVSFMVEVSYLVYVVGGQKVSWARVGPAASDLPGGYSARGRPISQWCPKGSTTRPRSQPYSSPTG